MAEEDENLSVEERVDRSVARTLKTGLLVLIAFALAIGWASLGAFTLVPGEAAIVLQLGRHVTTISEPGFHMRFPPPFETREVVRMAKIAREEFGIGGVEAVGTEDASLREAILEASMQTQANNIVRLSFVVQYRIKDPFQARYRIADSGAILRDAAQAAVREVVGRMSIDGVLSARRGDVQYQAAEILQEILDSYESGLIVTEVQLQDVQPPPEVREAFDDVIAAAQDASRAVNEAEGYQNELLPRARGEAAELIASADGYRDAKIAVASGEAQRFVAVATEYRKAPEVTQKRLYLETMEEVLPAVEKVIIEPGTTNVLPYLPLGRQRESRPHGSPDQ